MSCEKVLRCAVVGLGRIAWSYHLVQICKQPGFSLAAVVDPDVSRLKEAEEKFHPEAVFTDFETMLQQAKPDLTVIASPTIFHKEQTILAFKYGSDVFCDKPMALDLSEAQEMYSAAQQMKRKLMVYQPHRITGEALTAIELINSGKLGRIFQMERHITNYARRNDWQAFLENGGGMLVNYGAHFIDQLLYLAKSRTARVKCELRRMISAGNADDVVNAFITTENDTLLIIDINQAVSLPMPSWRICGVNGTALFSNGEWTVKYFDPAELPAVTADRNLAAAERRYPSEKIQWKEERYPSLPADSGNYYRYCYEYFAGDGAPFVPVEETLEVMRTLRLCREDAAAEN